MNDLIHREDVEVAIGRYEEIKKIELIKDSPQAIIYCNGAIGALEGLLEDLIRDGD